MLTSEYYKICNTNYIIGNIKLSRKNTERNRRTNMQNTKGANINLKKEILAKQKQYREAEKEKLKASAKDSKQK